MTRSAAARYALIVSLLAMLGCSHRTRTVRQRPSTITQAALRFVFFDLGQADAMLVVYQGHTLLMDAGESRNDADQFRSRKIPEVLEALTGRRHLDFFVVSHYHQDHLGDPKSSTGLWGLLDDGVTIGTLIDRGSEVFGRGTPGDTQRVYEAAVPKWLERHQVAEHRVAHLGEQIALGDGLRIDVVAAAGKGVLDVLAAANPSELASYPASENDYSVALKLTYKDFELFTGGDLTGHTVHRDFSGRREGYHDVESITAGRVGDVEVYRADHHGSEHSSSPCFLSVLKPEVSIISAGENNYGHPALPVYDRLTKLGRVYITGGADHRVKRQVERSIVGGDITVMVDEDGKRFSVNGKDFTAQSEETEALHPGPKGCDDSGATQSAE